MGKIKLAFYSFLLFSFMGFFRHPEAFAESSCGLYVHRIYVYSRSFAHQHKIILI